MSDAISSIKKNLNKVLSVRESVGADLKKCYFVTREWDGRDVGEGNLIIDNNEEITPTPRVVRVRQKSVWKESGSVKEGDIVLTGISKESYPLEEHINGIAEKQNVDRLYKVGDSFFNVIDFTEKHLTWEVLLRPVSSLEID